MMLGTDLAKAQRAVYAAAVEILSAEEIPDDLWAVVIDAAAGQVKDFALAAIAMEALDWRGKALEGGADARDDSGGEDG